MKKYLFKKTGIGVIQILSKKIKSGAGFTLIELLVVMFIIAILATLIIVSYNYTRARARDSRRKTDLRTIQTALEVYGDTNSFYPEAGCYSRYTPENGEKYQCNSDTTPYPPEGMTPVVGDFAKALITFRDDMQIEAWPEDPRSGESFNAKGPFGITTITTGFYNYGYLPQTDKDTTQTNPIPGSGYVLGCSMETDVDGYSYIYNPNYPTTPNPKKIDKWQWGYIVGINPPRDSQKRVLAPRYPKPQ